MLLYVSHASGRIPLRRESQFPDPPGLEVHHVEKRLAPAGLQRRLEIDVVFLAGEKADKSPQLCRRWRDYEIKVLGCAGRTVICTREGSREHVWDAGFIERRRDSPENFRDVHRC